MVNNMAESKKFCKHSDGLGYCDILSDNETRQYCVEGPCLHEELIEYVPVGQSSKVALAQEWMPVTVPPKEDGIYCVAVEAFKCRKQRKRTHARYKNGRWLDLYDNWENRCWKVTHWMPLPELPKGE